MALQLLQPPRMPTSAFLPSISASSSLHTHTVCLLFFHQRLHHHHHHYPPHDWSWGYISCRRRRRGRAILTFAGKQDGDTATAQEDQQQQQEDKDEDDVGPDPTPQDLGYVDQIKKVLELLKKNRDMLFSEVKLTIMIEDPREVERRRLLGIDDADTPTRDDLVAALEEVNEGRIPKDQVALRVLAEEMIQWPNLEAEPPKKAPSKSLYAKATDTGVSPEEAAKRLKIDWDSAAEIEEDDVNDNSEVPPAVGYGALYLVTAFPIIIGVSVVLILFYNSLQ